MAPSNLLQASPTAESAFDVAGLRSLPGLQAVSQRLTAIALRPLLAAAQQLEGVAAPSGLLLYGPPDPARRAFVSALRGDIVNGLSALGAPSEKVPTLLEVEVDELEATFAAMEEASPDLVRPLVLVQSDEPWTIDADLLRSGRLDRLVFVAPPDWEARQWRLRVCSAARALMIEQHLDELTAGTNGWTGADIARLLDVLRSRTATPAGPELLDAMATVRGSAIPWLEQARAFCTPGRSHVDDLRTYLERFRLA